jgi:hypothetical protein
MDDLYINFRLVATNFNIGFRFPEGGIRMKVKSKADALAPVALTGQARAAIVPWNSAPAGAAAFPRGGRQS